MTHRRSTWPRRVYGVLLRVAYPARFRTRFGMAMQETFDAEHLAARQRGCLGVTWLWIVTLAQALWFGTAARAGAATPVAGAISRSVTPYTSTYFDDARVDARYAARVLARSPVLSATAVLSLAVGLAAFTTFAGIGDALLLQAGPGVRDADRLVDIARSTNGGGDGPLTRTAFETLRAQTRTVESMAAATRGPVPLSLHDETGSRHAFGLPVSAAYFDVLQVRPALGRFFHTQEDVTGDPRPVVVLSYELWRDTLQADAEILARPLRLNGITADIVGVAEPGFHGTTIIGTDLWIPMALARTLRGAESTPGDDGSWPWSDARAVGRLRDGVTRDASRAELNAVFAALRADTPSIPRTHGVAVDPSGRLPPRARPQFAAFVALISALAAGLLVVACTNVAGMLLARATTRRHEVAMRLSLGASRGRLLRQMLLETLVLFALAALVALPLAWWLTGALSHLMPSNLPLPIRFDVALSYRTLLLGMSVALVAGLVFGLAPARHALATDLSQLLGGRPATDGPTRMRLRHALVVAQVALSLAMAITTGLLVRTLHAAAHVDLGFRTANVMMATIDTSMVDVSGDMAIALVGRLTDELRTIDGVDVVGHGSLVPLEGNTLSLGSVRTEVADGGGLASPIPSVDWEVVSPDYFQAIGLPIVAGRAFGQRDRQGEHGVVIVNESFARAAWPDQTAVGRQVWHVVATSQQERVLEVVGVARDGRYRYVAEPPRPMLYLPFAHVPQQRVHFYIVKAPGRSVEADIRHAVARVEPRLPVVLLRSFDDAAAISLLPQRFAAWVAGSVGGLAAVLAALGLYGVVALLVAHRAREIAVRIALGASQAAVRRMVLRRACWLGIVGALLGTGLALGIARGVQHLGLLIGVSAADPLTYAALLAALGATLLAASYLPARRAAATDPAFVLRAQ